MKHQWRFAVCMCVVLLLAVGLSAATAPVDWESLCTYGDSAQPRTKIMASQNDEGFCLVLPAGVSPNAVPLELTVTEPGTEVIVTGAHGKARLTPGGTVNLNALCGSGTRYSLTIQAGTQHRKLTILCSENVAAMYLVSDDPQNRGRAWVEASEDKSNKATGAMVLLDPSGETVYDGVLTQIKGRGNTTWSLDKKPYQIKLADKTDLLQTGDRDNRARTWVLLANRADPSLLRNQVLLNLGAEMGMDCAMENRLVDLYYDGEYRGSYLLTEKVEVGSGRVAVRDLEEGNEAANPDVQDLEDLPREVAVTENGATYTYCVGMASPEDISGGYLLEMELSYRTAEEACYFYTTRGNYIVVKSPEFASREEMDYIASLYQDYEDAVYNGGVHPVSGASFADYVDLESTVRCYLINELSKNLDGFRTSAFLYKEAGVDQMKMGPLWDYDKSLGGGDPLYGSIQQDPTGYYALYNPFTTQLYEIGAFRLAVKEQYQAVLVPLVDEILLGDETRAGGTLRSLAWCREAYSRSAACDYALWYPGEDWTETVDYLVEYLQERSAWLGNAFAGWNGETYEPVGSFLDVDDPDKWYYEAVQKAAEYNLMKGTDLAIFTPAGITVRAQVVQVLYNMARPGGLTEYEQQFSDVQVQSWYGVPVSWAAREGYVKGYPDGTFRPAQSISRQELVTLLYRYEGSPGVDSDVTASFADAGSINKFARNAMAWAVAEGILEGYPDNTLRPLATTNRAELATIILRYYEKFVLKTET